jgi:hypothetical protein
MNSFFVFALHQILFKFKGKMLGDVINGGGLRSAYRILVGKPEEKRSGLIILKWLLRKCEIVGGI